MNSNWLYDFSRWFKATWVGWAILLAYLFILFWMAKKNWQVLHFPVFLCIFVAVSIALLVMSRYLKE